MGITVGVADAGMAVGEAGICTAVGEAEGSGNGGALGVVNT